MILRPASARLSRLATRKEAKKIARSTLVISAGWKDMGPRRIQIRAPLMLWPRPGTKGRMRKARPAHMAQRSQRRSRR